MANGRCRMHGGPSTGPRTAEGLANSRQARLRHGRYSASRKRLRRQLRWVTHFAKVLDTFDQMYRFLLDFGIAVESDQSPSVLAAKCTRALPLYEQYLKTLDAAAEIGIETSTPRLKRSERRVLAVLWAGSRDAISEDPPKRRAGNPLRPGNSVFRVLDDSLERVEELVGLMLAKIKEGFHAGEVETGHQPVEHPDHRTRLLAADRFCRLLDVLMNRAGE